MRVMPVAAVHRTATSRPSGWRNPFVYIVLTIALFLAALYVFRIGSDPPGLSDDEASIGYNAWTIAHYGTDQYGNHLPLFFVDFGDYKGPVATYLVAPLTWLFAGGSAVVRLPSVLAGLAICLVAGRTAFVLTRLREIAVTTIVLTAVQPWIFLQSHTMLEGNIIMVLCVVVACWCLAEANVAGAPALWWSAAGVALGVCVYAYSVGRLLALLIAAVAVLSFFRVGRDRILRFLFPIVVAYIVLGIWAFENPGALLARFQSVGLFADHPSIASAAARFVGNYATYFSPNFLLLHGDGNLRQTTGFGGVLLDATVPLMVIGAVRLLIRWRSNYARFTLLGAVVAPVPAALTLAAPHALRGAGLLPFLVLLMVEGMAWVWSLLHQRRLIAVVLTVAVVATAAPYLADFFTAYPARARLAFDTGEGQALVAAYVDAGRGQHQLFLSATLNQPVIQLMYAVMAPPPQSSFVRQARIVVVTREAQLDGALPGDVLVLGPGDSAPAGARLMFVVADGEIVRGPATLSGADLLRVYEV